MNCIIIEDELPAQKVLLHFLEKIPNIEVIKIFNSAIQARSFLNLHKVDILFLDINLPDISGIEFIKTIDNPPAVIMTTAYLDYAVESFELPTIVDYLVKPFSFDRFLKAINKVEKQFGNKNNKYSKAINNESKTIFVNVDKTIHKINLTDIKYIVSEKNYVTIVTTLTRLSYLESLKNLVDQLPQKQFLRVHKSFIVNSDYVSKISGNILFVGAEKIPIGRTYKATFIEKLKLT